MDGRMLEQFYCLEYLYSVRLTYLLPKVLWLLGLALKIFVWEDLIHHHLSMSQKIQWYVNLCPSKFVACLIPKVLLSNN